MGATLDRIIRRFELMRATDRAIIKAHFDLARNMAVPARAIFFAKRGHAMQACEVTSRIIVHRPDDDEPIARLVTSHQCHLRTCTKCERRRAKKMRRLHEALLARIWARIPDARISLLTLSSRNRPLTEAKSMLADHVAAVRRYYALAAVKRSHLGVLSGFEAAIRGTDTAPEIGIHSHHAQLITDACMVDGRYLDIMRIRELFRDCLRVDYLPQCWIKASEPDVDGDLYASARRSTVEAVKYCTKPQSYLSDDPPTDLFGHGEPFHVDPAVILHLTEALHNKQLVTMSGWWVKARKEHLVTQRVQAKAARAADTVPHEADDSFPHGADEIPL